MTATDAPIVALATPWGRSALAVVRLSGARCHDIVRRIARPLHRADLPAGRPWRVAYVDEAGVFDDGIAWLQRGPRSYTGEDAAELTLHGNPVLVERLIAAAVAAGAAPAGPGAFTRRAVDHGRLDLVRAEAVHQSIAATTRQGAAIARRALDGTVGAALADLRRRLIDGVAELEARLDVPGDETDALDDAVLRASLTEIAREARALAGGARAGHHLVHGARVALIGPVNAGKSSLFNALVGSSRAIVSPVPGTTRDVVEATGEACGLAVTWLDTAGERDTVDPIEAAGLAMAAARVAEVDLVVVVLRARPSGLDPVERAILNRTADRPRVVVCNGIDGGGVVPAEASVCTVAPDGRGVAALRAAVRAALVGELPADAVPAIAAHHQAASLRALAGAVDDALRGWEVAGEAVAAELLLDGIGALDALTGADTREDVLDAMFARFCVGK